MSPNAASLCGVAVAALAARFFVKEDLRYRQLGVLLFKVSCHTFFNFRFGIILIDYMAVFTESAHTSMLLDMWL